MSDWKNVQYKDGKMRTSEGGGGGGSSTFAGLDDVSFNNLQNGQVPKYNSTTQKWENANESGGRTVTDVQVDGVSVVNQQGVAEIETPNADAIEYDNQQSGLQATNMQDAIDELAQGSGGGGNVDDVEVNGVSVVNAQKVAEITSYKEVTLAEYQALPSSKTSDGVMYCIKDIGGADGFPPLIYSDEEREVGVWRDGKSLYQKTYDTGSISTGSTKVVDISSLNIDYVVNVGGCGYSSQYSQSLPLPFVHSQSIYSISVNTTASNSVQNANLQIATGSGVSLSKSSITIQYTKTTDVAGGGKYTTYGGLTHHYSENEQVIGTWKDGKPLYEKTITFTASPAGYVDVSNLHVSKMISCAGFVTQTNGNIVNLPYGAGNSDFAIPYYNTTNGRLYCSYSGSYNVAEWTVILQYTKTTD